MASSKKGKRKPGRFRRALLRCAALLLGLLLIAMAFQGDVIRLRCVELPLRDLPSAFDGVRIVYVSDIHITALN
ncbi:MAG: hypothetical protein J5602_10155, partial [Clostridia bacterium]|nr:hypothetical protein [Clostridia bacterium]